MPPKNIIIGSSIAPEKLKIAKEFRRNMTKSEKILWSFLRANRLDGYHFRRQQVISGFIVDFYCHKAGLAIEIDGAIHDFQKEYDDERDKAISILGISVLRIPNEAVEKNVENVLEVIKMMCEQGSKTGG